MLDELYDLKLSHHQKGIIFCFSGIISQNLLVEIGDRLKNKMKQKEENTSTILKVFSIFIEQAQNISHYSAEKEFEALESSQVSCGSGLLIVGYQHSHYYVSCGNLVENHSVPKLREQLLVLQRMNKDELKLYYKEQRKKETPEESKGAGLGFIELARKATHPIEFDFQPVNDELSFFALKVQI